MRPPIDPLLDSQIQIWRPTETDDSIGVKQRTYTVTSTVAAKLNRPVQAEVDQGPGLAPAGMTRWYGRPDIDVRARDVCLVVDGPETGKTFEVNGPPVRPREHHTQVDCIEWNGILPLG